MRRKITKTLFIGLGGTGNLALKYAKKRFYEIYGKEEETFSEFKLPLVEYLALDTDIDDLKKGIGADYEFGLTQNEYYHIKVESPKEVMAGEPFIAREWMPKDNLRSLGAIEAGASQIRAFGRLGLMAHIPKIKSIITDKVNNLSNWKQEQSDEYEVMGGEVNIVFCFSIAGGTGSGTFLDMAYLVQECLSNAGIKFSSQAYIVLPEIFNKAIKDPIAKTRIWSNSYGALRELEFFMEEKYTTNFQLTETLKIAVSGPPFKQVHLISDKNTIGTDYDQIPHIMELIGYNIVFKSGDLSVSSKSSWNNIEKELSVIPYIDKAKTQKPRYLGLGYAEIQYNTDLVANHAAFKYSAALADFIIDSNNRESDISLETRVLAWGIKEDEADGVIDTLLPPGSSYRHFVLDGDGYAGLDTRSLLEASQEAHLADHVSKMQTTAGTNLEAFTEDKIKEITTAFIYGKESVLNKGGINTAIDAIEKLQEDPFINRYMFQMKDEIENNYSGNGSGLKQHITNEKKRIQDAFKELSIAQDSIIFVRRGRCLLIIESLIMSYKTLLDLNFQQIRREYAMGFYAKLNLRLDEEKTKLSRLKASIEAIKGDFHKSNENENQRMKEAKLKPFVIDLHKKRLEELSKDSSAQESIKLSLFLTSRNMLLSSYFDATSSDVIKQHIHDFVTASSIIKDIKNVNLSSYLADLTEDEVVEHFSKIKKMSQPLLQVKRGKFALNMGDLWTESALWGVGGEEKVYELIKTRIEIKKPDFIYTHNPSFLMLSTLNYPAPIFALTNLQRYYEDYMNPRSPVSCDTDQRIKRAMEEANFHLVPKDKTKEKSIFTWIFGLILFQLTEGKEGIQRKGSKYFLKTKQARSTDQFWLDLETPWRDKAFEKAKAFDAEMLDKIKKHIKTIGTSPIESLIKEIAGENSDPHIYINKYSQLGKSFENLQSSGDSRDKEVLQLLEIELDFLGRLTIESMHDY